ncbi:uncharacterized protein LOC121379168 [Gigantopelta aegis]|uniref:uncharacterized protein LOC121379168 n=1 Tax=Gigantopelta aegis TaxID=1735272 RepID=UPI001B88D41C|nr:uncharacterized protein LOC121379168 [Gigantopelta aegis]
MNAVTVGLMFAVFICLSISQTFSISPCKQGFYYNSRARKCDDCANVCYHPADQYQLDECNTYCPDYLRKSTATDSAETTCPQGYYFDPHVGIRGKCEPCSVLCHRHVITRNTKDCKTKCAGFLEQGVGKTSKTRTDCPKGFYFDPHVGVKGKCEPCSVLCYAHKVTRNTEDCKSKCPDEYASKEAGANQTGDPVNATEQAGASGSSGEDSKKGKESRQLGKAGVASGDKTEGNNNVLIIAIACVVGVIGVICIVGRLVFFRFQIQDGKTQEDMEWKEGACQRRGKQCTNWKTSWRSTCARVHDQT